MRYEKYILFCTIVFGFIACTPQTDQPVVSILATPQKQLTAKQYIQEIKKSIIEKNLRHADDLYLSLRGAYSETNEVADAILLLSQAHIDAGEFLLSKYYADSYIMDYPNGRRLDKAAFLRVKSVFFQFKSNQTDPTLQKQMHGDSKVFLKHFSKSQYVPEVKKMYTVFKKILFAKNEEIAKAYEKMGKVKAAKYYRDKNKEKN